MKKSYFLVENINFMKLYYYYFNYFLLVTGSVEVTVKVFTATLTFSDLSIKICVFYRLKVYTKKKTTHFNKQNNNTCN